MVDVRRALPATPIAVLAGLVGATPWLDDSATPWMPVLAGSAVLVAAYVSAYRLTATWTERSRRVVGYLTAGMLGIVVSAVLALLALDAALCGGSAERCDDDSLALAFTLGAVGAPVLLVGLYTAVDRMTLPLRYLQRPPHRSPSDNSRPPDPHRRDL